MNHTDARDHLEMTTPRERDIVMTRKFNAPRSLVFDAFTKPDLIRRWLLGPDGWSMRICDVDLKPGGTFHYVWHNETDGKEFGVHGTYREIVRPDRVVHAENFDEPWYPGDAIVTTAFDESSGATTVTMTMSFESREARDGALESGMEKGVAASYDRLAGILAPTD
jgi:uncharacterized protein YndB with AHSA1/START domain